MTGMCIDIQLDTVAHVIHQLTKFFFIVQYISTCAPFVARTTCNQYSNSVHTPHIIVRSSNGIGYAFLQIIDIIDRCSVYCCEGRPGAWGGSPILQYLWVRAGKVLE